jgi:hypothetical protein
MTAGAAVGTKVLNEQAAMMTAKATAIIDKLTFLFISFLHFFC